MNEAGQISLPAELIRKGIHLCALVIPIGYFLIPFSTAISLVTLAAFLSLIVDIARFQKWQLWFWLAKVMKPIFREHEIKGGLSGSTYILFTAALVIVLFPKIVAVAAMVFIIVGDTTAALIGRLYGKHKIYGNKSLEGSAACLISLILVSLVIPKLPLMAGIAGAFVATLVELISGKLDDNLTVPLAAGATMLIVMKIMGVEQALLFDAFLTP